MVIKSVMLLFDNVVNNVDIGRYRHGAGGKEAVLSNTQPDG